MESENDNFQYGNGHFGKWFIDSFELPAYEYSCMQSIDYAAKTNTSGKDSIDHWHQVGNDRITLTAHNGGYMQYLKSDRGLQWLSYHDLQKDCLGGGICIIEKDDKYYSDLYNSNIKPPETYQRIFGSGYFQKIRKFDDFEINHLIYPPFGDDPVVLSEIFITNHSKKSLKLNIYEFWGIKIRNLIASLFSMLYMPKDRVKFGVSKLVSFVLRIIKNLLLFFHLSSEQTRDKFSSQFTFKSHYISSEKCLILTPKYKSKIPIRKDKRSDKDYYPNPIFLKSFQNGLKTKYFNDFQIQRANKSQIKIRKEYIETTDFSPCLMIGHELILEPNESKSLKFIFGTVEREKIPELIKKYENLLKNDFKDKNFKLWKQFLMNFKINSKIWLNRETMWHSYYLRSASLFDNYYNNHYLPQGNAYSFLHGVNGAVRDYVLFLLSMIYLNPNLAREMLEFILRTMSPDGKLPYATYGIGRHMGAFVHETSSDLHLFLLWGIVEYLYATRDFTFLKKIIPFYPLKSKKSSNVLERIRISVKFIFKKVGIGEHGLIKVGSGDWSDGISLFAKNRKKFLKYGESSFNSAFALYLIPHLTDLLEDQSPKITKFLKKIYNNLKKAILNTWNGRWFFRGYDGMGNPIGDKNLFLEHHVWLLLTDILSKNQKEILINNINKLLDSKSKTGQYILYPPANVMLNVLPRGWDVNGGIWPAMNFLLTWAYSRYDSDKGFQSLLKNSMAKRAEVYPNIWYGIWSGSDSYNAEYALNPGQTFIHPATPQTDFPIMNLNLHANFLNSIIKLVGFNPTFKQIIIDPKLSLDSFHLKTQIFELTCNNNEISGFYNPLNEDECILKIRKPSNWNGNITVLINQRATENFKFEGDWILIKDKIPYTGIKFSLKLNI